MWDLTPEQRSEIRLRAGAAKRPDPALEELARQFRAIRERIRRTHGASPRAAKARKKRGDGEE